NHFLAFHVLGMGFSGENELNGAVYVRQDSHEPLRIMQQKVRTLVRRKTPRKAQGQCVGIECLRSKREFLGGSAMAFQLSNERLANILHQRLTRSGAQLP